MPIWTGGAVLFRRVEPARLVVRVNDELVLDAGTREVTQGQRGRELLVHPPATTLFHQVLAHLREKSDPTERLPGTMADREGVAAAAATLRWGSYLAVLLDHDKPVWPETKSPTASRISDGEMARINIEASAALAEWIDIYRADAGGTAYQQLVDRAVAYLPMPRQTSGASNHMFGALSMPMVAEPVIQKAAVSRLAQAFEDAKRHGSRVLANAIVNVAWRNGPVEDVHAGEFKGCPLDQRRMTLPEERDVLRIAAEGLALGMGVCQQFNVESPRRSWPEQVLPYGLAGSLAITPRGWTLTEASREVRLPA